MTNFEQSWRDFWGESPIGYFLLKAGVRSLAVLAWVLTVITAIFFVLLFFVLLTYPGEDNVWEATQLLTFLNLLWMIPLVVLAVQGSARLTDYAFDEF